MASGQGLSPSPGAIVASGSGTWPSVSAQTIREATVQDDKDFYTRQVGFNRDHDVQPGENMRVVQMTPPGSTCSVVIGTGLPLGGPGSVRGVQLVVEDLDTVRSEMEGRGVAISEVTQMGPEGIPGSRYCFFEDPDHNMWAVQEYKRGYEQRRCWASFQPGSCGQSRTPSGSAELNQAADRRPVARGSGDGG